MPKYIKGLNKDTGHIDQVEGTYRYARNAILNDRVGAIQNEHGNSRYVILPKPQTPSGEVAAITAIGSIETTDDQIVLFTVADVEAGPNLSIIYLIEKNTWDNYPAIQNSATIILATQDGATVTNLDSQRVDVDLKFNINFPIEGTYKIDPDGDLIVYWTDNNVPPRSLNVTRQRSFTFVDEGTQSWDNYSKLYNKNPETSPNLTYIDRLNLFPHAGPVPHIRFKEITNGGALKSGTYYLFLAYVDIKATQTNYITSSLPVPITEDVEAVIPIERFDGCPADSQTGKMITWDITNLNTDYEYLRPVIVSRINNVEQAYLLNDIEINERATTITFSNLEGYSAAAVADVIIDAAIYDKAKTVAQLDNILYLGNLAGSKDVGYQRYANFIKVKSIVKTWEKFDEFSLSNDNLNYGFFDTPPFEASKENGYRDTRNMIEERGYMRDEVYALYIAFILNDGSMSYAYHIPGRAHFTNARKTALANIGDVIANNILDTPINEKWGVSGYDTQLNNMTSGTGKLFHFYDFSNQPASVDTNNTKMNFWENLNEFYPNTLDYEYWDAETDLDDNTSSGNDAYNLTGSNVRHHHFPSNNNRKRSMIDHSLENPSVVTSGGEELTHFFFTFDDITNAGTGWNGQRDFENVNVNHQYLWTGYQEELFGPFDQLTGPGGQFDGAVWQPPTTEIIAEIQATMGNNFTFVGSSRDSSSGEGLIDFEVPLFDGSSNIVERVSNDFRGDPNADSTGLNDGTPYGFLCYSLKVDTVSTNSFISQNIRPLGFKLSDVKIPADIANKVQGFRIYYASRDHNNRRILGQDHIKKASDVSDKDISACDSAGGFGSSEDFLIPWGQLKKGTVNFGTFHDFYMLNGGYGGESAVSKGISTATHVNRLHKFSYFCFKGPGHNYPDIDPTDTPNTLCLRPNTSTSFHICHNSNIDSANFNHFPITEKCRTYVNSDSIYDGRSLGFGKRVNNIGGERHILLGVPKGIRPIVQPDWEGPDAPTAPWAGVNVANSSSEYQNPNSYKVRMDMYNLCAFKTDMYSSIDTQRLVWTGYEVVGEDLANFIVDLDRTTNYDIDSQTDDQSFQTTDIYGGDTFICRHGYRMSHRSEWVGHEGHDRKTVIATICESTDNINLRHEESEASACFPGAPLKRVLDIKADVSLTDTANMKYNADYSLGTKDVKFPPALPLRDLSPSIFPNRVQRSAKTDNASVIDNYRVFLAAEIKDLPRNRGDLWNLISFNNLLYMHMQDSLFRTKGKQTMQLADGSEAFLGSGNIFEQEPDEMVQTDSGYAGTQSQWAALVTSSGYFCLDYRNRKVYMVTDKITDIGQNGLMTWFRDNIPFALENYGIEDFDNPIAGVGFHSVWDEKYSRILLTKRDLIPTATFITLWGKGLLRFNKLLGSYQIAVGQGGNWVSLRWTNTTYFKRGGWTVSYSPATSSWVSFHDYIPYLYTYEKQHMLSMSDASVNDPAYAYQNSIFEHSVAGDVGYFYRVLYPFEFEFIYNKAKDDDKVFYSFDYTVDVYNERDILLHDQGFTSFYIYTTHQLSGENPLEYLINTRRVGNEWKVNKFRDIATLIDNTDASYVGPHTGSNYGVPGANVAGTITNSVVTTQVDDMFTIDGMSETINADFINTDKPWFRQRKFTDKWLGIRLIYSNSTKNLIYLYATDVAAKQFYR